VTPCIERKLLLFVLLCDTKQHLVREVPVLVMKCMEGTRTQGGGGQEHTQTIDRQLISFLLLFSYILKQYRTREMRKYKRKTVRKSWYLRKKRWKKLRED